MIVVVHYLALVVVVVIVVVVVVVVVISSTSSIHRSRHMLFYVVTTKYFNLYTFQSALTHTHTHTHTIKLNSICLDNSIHVRKLSNSPALPLALPQNTPFRSYTQDALQQMSRDRYLSYNASSCWCRILPDR